MTHPSLVVAVDSDVPQWDATLVRFILYEKRKEILPILVGGRENIYF